MTDIAAQPWHIAARESFFAAIARHRSAARRVDAVSRLCAVVLALVVAILMSPLFYAALGLLLVSLRGTALLLLVHVSVALSGMFTWLPALLLHTLLR